jgi:hypothetical protein
VSLQQFISVGDNIKKESTHATQVFCVGSVVCHLPEGLCIWLPVDASLTNIYAQEISLDEKNKKLVELTTSTGYHGADKDKVEYYFGNLDEQRVVWSMGRDLTMQPPQDDGPVNSLPKMYAEVDGKQSTD